MKEALKRALEALETERSIYREHDEDGAPEYILEAITAIKAALAQQDGQSNFCAQCEAFARELKAVKQAALAAQPAQEPVFCEYCGGNDENPPNHCMDCARPQEPDYAYPTIEEYEELTGFKVNDTFRMGWVMARTTNDLFKQMEKNT